MVSSGSPVVPGPSAGVAGGRPGAVTVPGGGPSVGPRRRTLRSARRVKSGPRRDCCGGQLPGAAGPGNGQTRKGPAGELRGGAGGRPGPARGKAGRAGRGVVPGGDLVRARAVAGGGGSRPGCRPAGRAGLPPGTAGIHPPLRPPRQVRRAPAGLDARPRRTTGRCGPVPAPPGGGGGPGGGPTAGRAPRGHGGAHHDGARHRRPRAWCRAADGYGRARLRAARYGGWRICHGPLAPLRLLVFRALQKSGFGGLFSPGVQRKVLVGQGTRFLRKVGLPPSAFHVPRASPPCTWRETTPVSCSDVPGRERRRAAAAGRGYARRDRRPAGLGQGRYTHRRRGRGGIGCRRGRACPLRAGRALRGAGRSLGAGGGVAGCVRGGGGEPVGAGLVGDHLGGAEAD